MSDGFSKSTPTLNNKRLALLLSFVGQARLQFARLHSRLVFLWCRCICMAGIFAVADAFWRCGGICMARIFAIADAFFFPVMYKLHLQFTYFKTCRCFRSKNIILNLLISKLADASVQKTSSSPCSFYNLQMLPLKNGIFPQSNGRLLAQSAT